MNLASIPLFERLAPAQTVLIAGAGGGFDVFSGLPLYFALRKMGKTVYLANLSFSWLEKATGNRLSPMLLEVRADSEGPRDYFPEKYLCQWFEARGEDVPVYGFSKTGVRPLRDAYAVLARHLGLDAVLLVDGGTDSLLRGDESGLGTPCEDMASIAAVNALDVPIKVLASIGFGVDSYHGVCHAQVLETVAALAKDGGYLGAFSLLRETEEFALYKQAVEAVFEAMPQHPSIVNASIVSATEGDYGDVHRTARTRGSTLWINPLMAMYFAFDLGAVARRVLYLRAIEHTQTAFELAAVIEAFQRDLGALRPWEKIPV